MSDPRKLPTEQVAEIATEIYKAADSEDDQGLNEACQKWLKLKGYDKDLSPIKFSFHSNKQRLDFEVHVTGTLALDNTDTQCTRTSGYARWPDNKTEKEVNRVAGGLLLGIEAAISTVERTILSHVMYIHQRDQGDIYRIYDALRAVASINIWGLNE